MQHRDHHAPISPSQWSLPGGRVEPGDTPGRRLVGNCWKRPA